MAELLAKMFKMPMKSTDDLRHLEWSAASEEASHWFDYEPKPYDSPGWIIEGVAVPRALRKWQQRNPDKPPPFDWFIYYENPRFAFESKGQETMAKQIRGLVTLQKPWIGERWIDL